MKERVLLLLKRERITITGAFLGAIGGYLYWFFIGCNTGTCPITSSPFNSTIYGVVLGALLFSLFKRNEKKENENNNKG